jgi:hypothetical protein
MLKLTSAEVRLLFFCRWKILSLYQYPLNNK